MVDYLECFDLVYFVEFVVTCGETGSRSQKRRFLANVCQFSGLSFWVLARVSGVRIWRRAKASHAGEL